MPEHNRQGVGKSAAFVYLEITLGTFVGFLLWLILSRMTTPDVIGTSSTVLSLAAIFTTVVSLGIPNSAARFLGKTVGEQRFNEAKGFVKVSLLLTFLGVVAGSVAIFAIKNYWILNDLSLSLIVLTIVLMGSFAFDYLLRYVLISFFKAKILVIRQILSSIVKVVLAVAFILAGTGALGLTAAYSISQIVAVAVAVIFVGSIFKSLKGQRGIISKASARYILSAGFPAWVPAVISSTGAQLGTVVVFGASGASEAGTYFIAYAIFSSIHVIQSSLSTAALPVLSGMSDARKRFTWRIIKITAVASLPLSFSLFFYSEEILGLLGEEYAKESLSLEILLLSIFPTAVSSGLNTLVYSYGNYKQALAIGVALSAPRLALYFIAVPIYGPVGAAISFTGGSIIGFVTAVIIARKIRMIIPWKDTILLLTVPAGLALLLFFFQVNYVMSIVITYVASYIMLLKLKIITRVDIRDSIGIFPHQISTPTIRVLNKVGKKLNPSYDE